MEAVIYILSLETHNHPKRMFFIMGPIIQKETEKQMRETIMNPQNYYRKKSVFKA